MSTLFNREIPRQVSIEKKRSLVPPSQETVCFLHLGQEGQTHTNAYVCLVLFI